MRLTDDRTAECLRANNEKLRKAGYEVDPASERYVRLAEYERIAQTPEELREYISRLAERRDSNPEKNCKESEDWCADCDHIEMCKWYPTQGCEFKSGGIHPELRKSWSKQGLYPDGFGGVKIGYTCPYCYKYVPYAGKYCGKCGERVLGGDE